VGSGFHLLAEFESCRATVRIFRDGRRKCSVEGVPTIAWVGVGALAPMTPTVKLAQF
jgi:hypothetical protein